MGLCTRYDARRRASEYVMRLAGHKDLAPVCPEQLGGLSTPRPPAEIVCGRNGFDVIAGKARVMTRDGRFDVTDAFLKGAEECLLVAETLKVESCLLKSGSPSCGVSGVTGVAAAMLMLADFPVYELTS